MSVIISVLTPIVLSFVLVFFAKKLRVPPVVALIVGGILIGLPGIREFIIGDNLELMNVLGNVGLFVLMFVAGLNTSWKNLFKEKKDSAFIAFFAFIIPFILGFVVFYFVLKIPLLASLIVGIGMSVTAEATKAKVLIDLKALKSKMGSALIGAGIIDDFIGLGLFTIIVVFLGSVSFGENLITLGVIVAFFAGIGVQKFVGLVHNFTKSCKIISVGLIIPFFFVNMGLSFQPSLISSNLILMFAVILIGVSGKIFGTFLAKPFVNFSWKQLYVIGWAMNSRGAIEIALALIALKQGLINHEIYSSLILLSLVTTMVFPFIITHFINKSREILR